MLPARGVRVPVAELTKPGEPLVSMTVPGKRGASSTLELQVGAHGDGMRIDGTLAAGMDELSSFAARGPRRGVSVLLELEPGRYAVVPAAHRDLNGRALKALHGAMDSTTPVGSLDFRVRAVAVNHGRDVRVATTTP